MNYKIAALAIATAVAGFTGVAYAQQTAKFGRDTVYAAPGSTSSEARTPVVTIGYGRDTVYAGQLPHSGSTTTANVTMPQRLGRDTVYAVPFQNGSAQPTSTARTTATEGRGG